MINYPTEKIDWHDIKIGEVFAEKYRSRYTHPISNEKIDETTIEIWIKTGERTFMKLANDFSNDWEHEGIGDEDTLDTANPVIGWWALYKLPKRIQRLWLEG